MEKNMDAFVKSFLDHFDDSRFPADFLQDYEPLECLSNNEFGETLIIRDRKTGAYRIAKCHLHESQLQTLQDLTLLKTLNHKGVPRFIGEYRNEIMHCVVQTYAPGLSLDKWVQEHPLSEEQAVSITAQLCNILIYLSHQTPPVIHRDIKPQNIIMDELETSP